MVNLSVPLHGFCLWFSQSIIRNTECRNNIDSEKKFRAPDKIWTHGPLWSSWTSMFLLVVLNLCHHLPTCFMSGMKKKCVCVCVVGRLIKSWEWQLLIKSYQISILWLILRIISNKIPVLFNLLLKIPPSITAFHVV